ncbi:hypothetical protein N7532_007450 [Penicillium argentinense]|uniref:Wings apart-like protein C-terminal domain-containing protein n=1 Tax=Penicillium argentinense TaxID=1131581 RepID=A0A9W9K6R4_9EURO|nr:uncharacterized protein N7532_007450 [Penicillium argentinense]KAJ5095159.1 hypothetical protein N7532_007450 [Penicillium argentinense]
MPKVAKTNKRSRAPTLNMAAASAGPPQATDDSIYDIPSTDEEDTNRFLRRKRRRGGLDGVTASHQGSLVSSKPNAGENGKHQRDTKVTRANPEITPQRARKSPQDRRRPQAQKQDSGSSQPSPRRLRVTPPSIRTKRQQQGELSSDDELQGPVTQKRSLQTVKEPKLSVQPPSSLSSRKHTESIAGNTTPGRRRLIDSLGVREQSVSGSSLKDPGDSQLSSPIATQSPIRPREVEPPNTPIDNQFGGPKIEPNAAPSPHLQGSKVTYARQRSFLDDLSMAGGPPAGMEETGLLSPQGPTAAIPRARLFAIEDVANDDGSVRSIHELRQAGGNARYRSAVESIFEDIEDKHISVSGRCSALTQICDKLLDPKQARQFVDCGFDKRLVDFLSRDMDAVTATLTLCAFGLSSMGRSMPYILATGAWPKLLDTASQLLDDKKDMSAMIRARENNLSKATQAMIQDILPRVKSVLFEGDTMSKLSPCLLTLLCLQMAISAFQAKGESPSGLPTSLLGQLVNLLLSESLNGAQKSPERSQVLILGLTVLEAHTTSSDLFWEDHRDILKLLPQTYGLLRVLDESDETSQELQTLYIRVILNITNSNGGLCDDYATPAMIDGLSEIVMSRFNDMTKETLSQPEGKTSLDTVILALGALINMTEQSETSRSMFLNLSRGTQSLLDRLLDLFLAHVESTAQVCTTHFTLQPDCCLRKFQADSVPEVHHNVAVGYLAVLLLSLCLDRDVRLHVKEVLHPKGLSVVVSTVDEFMQYHRKIEQELYPMQEKREAGGFLGRLQDLVGQIQLTGG